MKTCNKCNISQDKIEYYCKNKKTGRLSNKCRTCEAVYHGVVFIGKNKFHRELREQGLIKCSDCQEIQPLKFYNINNSVTFKYSQICKVCCLVRHKKYTTEASEKLTTSFLKQYLKSNYNLNVKDATPELLDIARLEIQIKREPKYFLDGKSFATLRDFAIYVRDNYSMGIHSTEARIRAGHTERQCTVSESKHRSEFNWKSSGKLIVTDMNTGEKEIFFNKTRLMKDKKIEMEVISRCLKSGEIRKPYLNSKNLQSLKIELYEQI